MVETDDAGDRVRAISSIRQALSAGIPGDGRRHRPASGPQDRGRHHHCDGEGLLRGRGDRGSRPRPGRGRPRPYCIQRNRSPCPASWSRPWPDDGWLVSRPSASAPATTSDPTAPPRAELSRSSPPTVGTTSPTGSPAKWPFRRRWLTAWFPIRPATARDRPGPDADRRRMRGRRRTILAVGDRRHLPWRPTPVGKGRGRIRQ